MVVLQRGNFYLAVSKYMQRYFLTYLCMTHHVSLSFYFRCNEEEQTKSMNEASATASAIDPLSSKTQ